MKLRQGFLLLFLVTTLAACATVPSGPSVMVLPAPGKSFDQFRADDFACRQWAMQQAGLDPGNAVHQNLVAGAAVGTLVGAGVGAAMGAASGNPGAGAAIGAGTGLLGGAAVASGPAYAAGAEAQRRYDMAYKQCMYAKGNQIPGIVKTSGRTVRIPPPPPPSYAPTRFTSPPPGYYPPPR